MDVVIITKVAQSVQHLLSHMRENANSCIVNDAVVRQPMPSMQQNAACYHSLIKSEKSVYAF